MLHSTNAQFDLAWLVDGFRRFGDDTAELGVAQTYVFRGKAAIAPPNSPMSVLLTLSLIAWRQYCRAVLCELAALRDIWLRLCRAKLLPVEDSNFQHFG